jgi:hypothetical protein
VITRYSSTGNRSSVVKYVFLANIIPDVPQKFVVTINSHPEVEKSSLHLARCLRLKTHTYALD